VIYRGIHEELGYVSNLQVVILGTLGIMSLIEICVTVSHMQGLRETQAHKQCRYYILFVHIL